MNSSPVNSSGKPVLRIVFTDFWNHFRPDEFWLYRRLAAEYELILDDANPDLLFFAGYGIDHLKYRCHKLFYSHENLGTNSRISDFSFCPQPGAKHHQYFSNFIEEEYFDELRSNHFSAALRGLRDTPKTKFCNFVYSNARAAQRIDFCRRLMKYQGVDCPGKVLNNQPPFDRHEYQWQTKIDFLKQYKFTIAFENESTVNYTTEKIIHPMIAGSIPIYWGNPRVATLFNPASFVNCHDFENFDAVIERVKEIDRDDKLRRTYLAAPAVLPDSLLGGLTTVYFQNLIRQIGAATATTQPVSQHPLYPLTHLYYFLKFKLGNRVAYVCELAQDWSGRDLISNPNRIRRV